MAVRVSHWSTVLDCIQAGVEGDAVKCRAYAELLAERLQADGQDTTHLHRVLRGDKGEQLHCSHCEIER